MARMIIPIIILLALEYYAFQSFSTMAKGFAYPYKQISLFLYFALTAGVFAFMFAFPALRNNYDYPTFRTVATVVIMAVVVAKLSMSIFLALDDVRRLITYLVSLCLPKSNTTETVPHAISRSAFMQKASIISGGVLFGTLIYGLRNRYNYKVHNVAVPIPNIPDALKKLRIVQISDVHSGSFTNVQAVQAGIDKIMQLQPDIIFFTGDLVNTEAKEMIPYLDVFAKLKARYGVFSILGNHDYGDYKQWNSAKEKLDNLNELKGMHQRMGWDLLCNENRILDINGTPLAIVGVENISGSNRFHSYGDLGKAYAGVESVAHRILLSHDPSHWDAEVNNGNKQIMLTLSGHTHGMQFGVEIPGFKWSPVQYIYKKWAGLYTVNDMHLYVNRGYGFLGYSGRVGILPEITALKFV